MPDINLSSYTNISNNFQTKLKEVSKSDNIITKEELSELTSLAVNQNEKDLLDNISSLGTANPSINLLDNDEIITTKISQPLKLNDNVEEQEEVSASTPTAKVSSSDKADLKARAETILNKLKADPSSLGLKIEKELQTEGNREALISYFGLDSEENVKNLKAALFTEAGEGKEDTFAVGAVIINRALSANMKNEVDGDPERFSLDRVIREKNQFQIVRHGQYDKERNNPVGQIDNTVIESLMKGGSKDPVKGKNYSNMYFFQTNDQKKYGRKISFTTPNGHVFSHGFDSKNRPYVEGNMLGLPPDQAKVPKAKKKKIH